MSSDSCTTVLVRTLYVVVVVVVVVVVFYDRPVRLAAAFTYIVTSQGVFETR
jgi:hypothetical protein